MAWTRCEDCIYQPECDWPDQMYGACDCGTPKPEEVELLKKEKEHVMDAIDKILSSLIVTDVGDHGYELVKLGNSMVNGSGDEMDKFGIELMQIANHIADWSNNLVAASDPERAKELQPKFDSLKSKWEEEHPDIPFLR